MIKASIISTVQHEDNSICVPGVGLPQWPNLLLSSHIPDKEGGSGGTSDTSLDPLAVEADGGDRVEELVELHHVEGGRLAGPVQPDHDHVNVFPAALYRKCIQKCTRVFSCTLGVNIIYGCYNNVEINLILGNI